MQADAEHQQDDADLGQLAGQRLIRDESRRIGPERYAGEQIADEGRDADALCDGAENEGEAEAHDDRGDEWGVVRHALEAPHSRLRRHSKDGRKKCTPRAMTRA